MTSAYLLDWLNMFFRWFHVIAGVAWIGASFYFIWLDLSLEEPPEWKKKKGISGDLWAVHGGGFYEVAKYKLEPEKMPEKLHWFKWEAYTTWLTGMAMMTIVYYVGAQSYLIDTAKVEFSQFGAISASLCFLFGSYVFYEFMLKSKLKDTPKAFALVMFTLLVVACWGADQLFSDRAAYIHIGALLGTIMVANVFRGIMPAQRALVDCVSKNQKPDEKIAALAAQAKLRSTHNNYFTLPLIFIMLSNHYPMTYGHEYGWLILVIIGAITALARHYFNQKHIGKKRPQILWAAAACTLVLIYFMRPMPIESIEQTANITATQAQSQTDTKPKEKNTASLDSKMMNVINQRCTSCHSKRPTFAGINAAPAGIMLQQVKQVKQYKQRILTAVQSKYMPLGNVTKITPQERAQLLSWVKNL